MSSNIQTFNRERMNGYLILSLFLSKYFRPAASGVGNCLFSFFSPNLGIDQKNLNLLFFRHLLVLDIFHHLRSIFNVRGAS